MLESFWRSAGIGLVAAILRITNIVERRTALTLLAPTDQAIITALPILGKTDVQALLRDTALLKDFIRSSSRGRESCIRIFECCSQPVHTQYCTECIASFMGYSVTVRTPADVPEMPCAGSTCSRRRTLSRTWLGRGQCLLSRC